MYLYSNIASSLFKKVIIFKHIVITVEIHFISHVANGIHIIIHNDVTVYVHLFKYCFPKLFSSNSISQELFSDDFFTTRRNTRF